ncbi:hypothetical protein SALBM311S_08072 [Streptomyces alboniger]
MMAATPRVSGRATPGILPSRMARVLQPSRRLRLERVHGVRSFRRGLVVRASGAWCVPALAGPSPHRPLLHSSHRPGQPWRHLLGGAAPRSVCPELRLRPTLSPRRAQVRAGHIGGPWCGRAPRTSRCRVCGRPQHVPMPRLRKAPARPDAASAEGPSTPRCRGSIGREPGAVRGRWTQGADAMEMSHGSDRHRPTAAQAAHALLVPARCPPRDAVRPDHRDRSRLHLENRADTEIAGDAHSDHAVAGCPPDRLGPRHARSRRHPAAPPGSYTKSPGQRRSARPEVRRVPDRSRLEVAPTGRTAESRLFGATPRRSRP